VLVLGTIAGLVWGAFARLWMRWISTDAEFSWSGTNFILGAFAVVGLSQSAAYLGRRAELRRGPLTALRLVTTVCLLPLGMGAGMLLFPTVVLAPLAWFRTRWPAWLRGVVGVLAALPFVMVVVMLFADLAWWRAIVGAPWCAMVYGGLVWAARWSLAPVDDGWRVPTAVRTGATVVLGLGVLLLAAAVIGVGG